MGVTDGGPGLPFLGWSTEGGDLRIPHFVGLHALQAIPLGLLALELLSRRYPVLRDARVRFRLVLVGTLAFTAVLIILTWQALSGESIVQPSAPVIGAGVVTAAGTVGAAASAVIAGKRARVRAVHPRNSSARH